MSIFSCLKGLSMSTENNYEQEAIELICAEVKHSAAALQGYLNTPREWNSIYTLAVRNTAESLRLKADLAAANAQLQELQQGRCGMCNEFLSNPVHGSGEGQHAFVTSEAEIMRQNAAATHQAQRYAALEKRLETMAVALREARSFIVVVECEEGLTTENLIAQIDAALVSEDGL